MSDVSDPTRGGVRSDVDEDEARDAYVDALTGLVLVLLVFGFPRGIVGSLKSDSPLRERVRRFVDDPSVAGQWASDGVAALGTALSRAKRNLLVLVFGVR